MFGNTAISSSSNKLEFKAGRMSLVESVENGIKKKMVHADKRKGLVYIFSSDDGLTHFCWKDRTTGNVEDDLIIFPDDCEFKRISECKDGRVFLLKFKSTSRKLFFWLQEPSTEKDEEYCRKVNELLNNPPASNGGGRQEGSDLQYMLNNLSQQQLMQLFGGANQMGGLSSLLGSLNRPSSGRSATSTTTTSTTSVSTPTTTTARSSTTTTGGTNATVSQTPAVAVSAQPATPRAPRKGASSTGGSSSDGTPATTRSTEASRVLLSELKNYLAGISAGGSKQSVDLSTSLNSESINSILSDPDRLQALQAHLPNISETDDEKQVDTNTIKQQLKDTLASPQFQQALSMFSNALQSGQLGPVVSQFKLNDDAVLAANSGDLEQFVKALEKASIKDSQEDEKNNENSDVDNSRKDESKN